MSLPFLAHLRGRLDECILLTFRTPADSIRSLLPAHLTPITHRARGVDWAFWNIALCSVESLRPVAVPRALGMACQLISYRLLVRPPAFVGPGVTASTDDRATATQPGMYFCRTDIDHSLIARSVALSGELAATPRPCQIFISTPGRRVQFIVRTNDRLGDAEVVVGPPPMPGDDVEDLRTPTKQPNLHLVREDDAARAALTPSPGQCDDHNVCIPPADRSIFSSIDEARHVLMTGPVGFGAHNGEPVPSAQSARPAQRMKFVETRRDTAAWDERPIVVYSARFGYLASLGQTELAMELAVRVQPIECRWRVGKSAKVG